ncbi:MAG: RNA polymerase factor sigma-54 [Burkholderiaceae bacterium]|nr:RNA polymerase factor sigma-54 [Burkholderiaceae bacterium]
MHAPGLQLRATQGAALSQQMQQGLKMLQMSALELEQAIAQALSANPLLESDDALDDAGADEGETIESRTNEEEGEGEELVDPERELTWATTGNNHSGERSADDPVLLAPAPQSLRDHLLSQVNVSGLGERDLTLARVLVEALDEDGYLRDSLEEIAELIEPGSRTVVRELEVALSFVQSLDPVGVGARSVSECLLLQLRAQPRGAPCVPLAMRIVESHLDLLAAHDTVRITRMLGCSESDFAQANQLIRSLAPRPASIFGSDDPQHVVPDVTVRKVRGRWVAFPNSAASPRLRINRLYADAVRRDRGWSSTPMGTQLTEARWLLRSIEQRAETILKVASAIVATQQGFFEHGDVAIRPLHLRDIAAEVGVHESTVSRVTSGKYMATPRGLIEFKHFFGSRLVSEDGYRISPRAIQTLIRDIVESEDPKQPLSDIRITRQLEQRGASVARRTVTKYRDAIGIPPVEARRMIAMAQQRT